MRPNQHISTGLQLQIHSWENDGDSPSVQTISGLRPEDVRCLVNILTLFKSQGGYGNGMNSNWLEVAQSIFKIYLAHPGVSQEVTVLFGWLREAIKDWDTDALADGLTETMDILLGIPSYEEYDFRVFDRFQVFDFPVSVQEVTDKYEIQKS